MTGVGQWALRGGIVDVFSPAGALPVRLELVGDEVESLRTFDPTSQRSTGSLASLLVLPMLPGGGEDGARLRDYFPAAAPVAVADAALLEPGTPEAVTLAALGDRPRIDCGLLVTGAPDAFRLETRSIEGVRGQLRRLEPALGAWRAEGFGCGSSRPTRRRRSGSRRSCEIFEHDVPIVTELLGPDPLAVLVAGAHVGFECPGLGLVCLTETELFGHRRTMRRRPTYQRGAAIAAFTDLGPGDLVVHGEHGIGRYAGLVTLSVDGQPSDYLLLEYEGGDRLYVPVERMNGGHRYVGCGEAPPRLRQARRHPWERTKESVRASPEMAQSSSRLYAERECRRPRRSTRTTPSPRVRGALPVRGDAGPGTRDRRGHGRPRARSPWTGSSAATSATARPRWRCARLLVVLDGHQVAVLVPTTILAQQHLETFRARFAGFPCASRCSRASARRREQGRPAPGWRRPRWTW